MIYAMQHSPKPLLVAFYDKLVFWFLIFLQPLITMITISYYKDLDMVQFFWNSSLVSILYLFTLFLC